MDDDIGSEFLLLARTNAVLSAFAVCTLLSISDGTLLYGKSTAKLPVVAVSLSVSVIGLVFPALMLGACLVGRMLLPRLRPKDGAPPADGIIAFALGGRPNAALAYLVVFAAPILASLYCLWRIAIVPGLYPHACLLSTAAMLFLLWLAAELVFYPKPMPRAGTAGFAVAGMALAVAQLTPASSAWHVLARAPAAIDMAGADLQGVFARGDTRLFGANLSHAKLGDSDLQGANLVTARMAEAQLDNTRADGGFFVAADLRRLHAEMGSFTGAYLQGAAARGADFSNSVMLGVHAHRLSAAGADFQGIDAAGADFSEATLTNVHFWGASLPSANFAGANLGGAEFGGAVLDGAVLNCALIQGTALDKAKGLVQAQLAMTMGDEGTKLPAYLVKPTMWANSAAFNAACNSTQAHEVAGK